MMKETESPGKGRSTTLTPCFVQRCRVCGHEVLTDWGPETHSLSALALRDHLAHHSFTELQQYVMRAHLRESIVTPGTTPIPRAVVQDKYDQAALTVSRIRSEAIDDEYWNDDDTLAYYEGKRDALQSLLEPLDEPEPSDG